ncbi:hypothetical protein N7G274_010229 [Stereocaulon virgatum]|uniref:Uncharacterized protein n=1 Tax=Stereocaulon virgatum TaxID=373712 RepID=A0ABR3ZU56_9LECA
MECRSTPKGPCLAQPSKWELSPDKGSRWKIFRVKEILTIVISAKFGAAPEKGHEGSVRLLFYDCASPERRGGSSLSPQVSAIIGRNHAFLDIVIDKLIDANAQEGRHAYALNGYRIF